MASQREWESAVWHFLGDSLSHTDPEAIKDWIYGFQPTTPAQEDRWLKAIEKVQEQLDRFTGVGNECDDDCIGNSYWEHEIY